MKDKGGQDMTFSFSIQYKLNNENVGRLFSKYKQEYNKQFVTWVESEVRKVVGTFHSTAFWDDRASSAELIRKAIDEKFIGENDFVTCKNLQIINV
jgi:hypothetical protein